MNIKFFFKNIIFAICFMLQGGWLVAQDFSEKQKAIIYDESIKMLKTYQQYSNELADNVVDMDELNKINQKIIDLFVSRKAIIYNDLDPSHKLSNAYELETYMANMLLWYPDGMKIFLDFDNLKAGNIISHGNDIFTVDIMTSKRIDGNYLNQQQNNQTEDLLYRIAFFKKNNALENFKIAGVRSTKATTVTDDSKLLAEVKSVTFSEKDMQQIKDQARSLLSDYINFLNLLTDPKETSEDKGYYSISFIGLFKDSTLKIANDIEPDPQERWIPVAEYKKNLMDMYPDGVKNVGINIDSTEFGKVIPEGNEKYYINGYINKFFSGKYLNKTIFRDNSKYDFKVSFERDENTFKNFKLASIDKFGINLYNQSTEKSTQELPQNVVGSIKRKGLYWSASVGGGITNMNDPNLSSNSILNWTIQGKPAYNMEVKATWYFFDRMGINAGIGFNSYSVKTSLTGDFRNTTYYTDINGESYLMNVSAAYDSLINFNYLSIPISVILHSKKDPKLWGFYAEITLEPGFNIGSKYKSTGSLSTSGYYEQYPESMQIITAPELGFVTRTNINTSEKAKVPGFQLAFKTSIGISWPLNYFTYIYLGPEFCWNLSNASSESSYTDAFGNTSASKKVGISKYGIKFGINYKF